MADPYGISVATVELLAAAGADLAVAGEHGVEVRARLEAQGTRYDRD